MCEECRHIMDAKMTNAEYHSTPALSKSDLDLIAKSPLHYKLSKEEKPDQTAAMLLGSVTHKLTLEPETFANEYIVAPDVDKRTKDGKAKWSEFLNEVGNLTVIDSAMYEQAKRIADAVMKHPVAAKLLQGGQAETSYFWKNGDIECKCRPDYLRTDIKTAIDLKTTQCSSPDEFVKSAYNFRYYVQAAWYTDGLKACGIDIDNFIFIAVESKPPYPVVVYVADELMLKLGRTEAADNLETYRKCLASGEWFGYEEKPKVHSLSLPDWVLRKYF